VHLIKYENNEQLKSSVSKYLDEQMCEWLVREVSLNGRKVITDSQKEFWKMNKEASHDPRGTEEYVTDFVDNASPDGHKPHVNIIQAGDGKRIRWARHKAEEAATNLEDDEAVMTSAEQNLDDMESDACVEATPRKSSSMFKGFFQKK
ncbi:hypothetical protein Ciccas_007969, partial [Cichlidogyrus casuarinus]